MKFTSGKKVWDFRDDHFNDYTHEQIVKEYTGKLDVKALCEKLGKKPKPIKRVVQKKTTKKEEK